MKYRLAFSSTGKYVQIWIREGNLCLETDELPWSLVSKNTICCKASAYFQIFCSHKNLIVLFLFHRDVKLKQSTFIFLVWCSITVLALGGNYRWEWQTLGCCTETSCLVLCLDSLESDDSSRTTHTSSVESTRSVCHANSNFSAL